MLVQRKLKLISCVALAVGFALPFVARAEVIDGIVAIVNDEIITLSDVKTYNVKLKNGALVDDLLVPDDATKQKMLNDPSFLLSKMVDERLIDSEVKKQNLSVAIEKVEQEIRNIAHNNNISRDELKQAVEEKGTTFSQYQDFIRRGLERQALIEKVIVSKIKISEDDVLAQYANQNGDQQSSLFEYTIAHIFFDPAKGSMAQARQRADAILEKLKAGSAFEQTANDYSEDPNFSAGGVLGTFKTGEMSKDFEGPIVKLAPGEFTGVLQTKAGIEILKLVQRKIIADPKMDAAKEKIRAQLYERAYKKQFQAWLDQAHAEAFIRVNSADQKVAPPSAPEPNKENAQAADAAVAPSASPVPRNNSGKLPVTSAPPSEPSKSGTH